MEDSLIRYLKLQCEAAATWIHRIDALSTEYRACGCVHGPEQMREHARIRIQLWNSINNNMRDMISTSHRIITDTVLATKVQQVANLSDVLSTVARSNDEYLILLDGLSRLIADYRAQMNECGGAVKK